MRRWRPVRWCFRGFISGWTRAAHRAATTQLSEPETVLFSALMELMVFAGILVGFGLSWPSGLGRVGFGIGRIPRGVVIGIVAIIITMPVIFVVNDITETTLEHFNKSHPAHQLLEVLKTNPPVWLRIADVLSAGLIAPVAEEMFFRGLLQTMFRAVFKRSWPAIVVAAALFALVHPAWSWPQILVLGTCLGYTYERTGNLWASITMHASFNLFSIYLFTHFT